MKKLFILSLASAFLAAGFLIASISITQAQSAEAKKSFRNITPFALATGRMGFFDTTTGTIFIYDDNVEKCTYIGEIDELGKPIKRLQ